MKPDLSKLPETTLGALIAIVAGLALIPVTGLGPNQKVWILTSYIVIFPAVLVFLAWRDRQRKPAGETQADVVFEDLSNRQALYDKAALLLRNAREIVIDTTWGCVPREPGNLAKQTFQTYEAAKQAAISRNVTYQELFSEDPNREERVRKALEQSSLNPDYQVKQCEPISPMFPLLDFMVVDNEYIILSNVQVDGPGQKYLYIKSRLLGDLLMSYFRECWSRSLGNP